MLDCIYNNPQKDMTTVKKAINIRLDEDLLFDLDNYAKELDRTRT